MILLPRAALVIDAPLRKAFDLRTEEQKAHYWRGVERLRTGFYASAEKQLCARFETEKIAILQAIRGIPPEHAYELAQGALAEQAKEWERTITAIYLAVGEAVAPRVQSGLKATAPGAVKSDDAWKDFVLAWLRVQAGIKVSQIQDTTLEQLRRALMDGVDQGEGIRDLAKRVESLYAETIEPWRAVMIARTEVVSASNAASVSVARSTGVHMNKVWLSTRDDRTRDTHREVDGQEVGIDEPFNVSGWGMMWPGDSSMAAPAGEIVNCRCTVTYRRN